MLDALKALTFLGSASFSFATYLSIFARRYGPETGIPTARSFLNFLRSFSSDFGKATLLSLKILTFLKSVNEQNKMSYFLNGYLLLAKGGEG